MMIGFDHIIIVIVLWAVCGCYQDILINEINSDNPSSDTAEFVELWNPRDCWRSLDGYTLVFFNGFYEPPPVYLAVNLSGYCIESRGYLLIGSSSVVPTPDIIPFSDNGVQNGLGEADAVALYKNKYVPTEPSSINLVDAVIYDKQQETDADIFFPSLMSPQTPVFEDETVLTNDESISRCSDAAVDLSTFTIGELTPGADNFCMVSNPSDWLTDCSEYNGETSVLWLSSRFQMFNSSTVAGFSFSGHKVRTSLECAQECSKLKTCARFSFTSSLNSNHNCLLYFSCQNTVIYDDVWSVGVKVS